MGMIKKSISVTDKQNQWTQSHLKSGEYASDCELLKDFMREEQRRNEDVGAVREALITDEKSGYSIKPAEQILREYKKAAQ